MTCRDLIEVLADYLASDLPAAQRTAFERHLAICPPCVTYLKTYQDAIRLGKAALRPSNEPTPGLPEGLVRAVLAARRASP